MTAVRPAPRAWLAFGLSAIAVWLACRGVVASPGFARRPDVVGAGVVLDLVVVLPALAWLLLVRTGRLSPRALVAVVAAGAAAARMTLPANQHALLAPLARVGVVVELLLVGWIGWSALRIARGVRASGGAVPFEVALGRAGRDVLGSGPVSWAVLTEASLLGFAFGSWRHRPHEPPGAEPFFSHRRLGLPGIFLAVALVGVVETLAVHLLVGRWSHSWAWILTGLSAYSLVWLAGDFRAIALRPTLLTREHLEVRIGVRWRVTIPRDEVAHVCPGPDASRHPGCLRATPFGAPNLYLHLSSPVAVRGPFGIERTTRCLGVRVDDPEALVASLGLVSGARDVTR